MIRPLYHYKLRFIFGIAVIASGLVVAEVMPSLSVFAQSTNPCAPYSGNGKEIDLAAAKTQQSNVANPGVVLDKNTSTSAILQPAKGSGSEASSYLAVLLPKSMVVTKIKIITRAEDAKPDKVNGYVAATGYGPVTPKKGTSTNLMSPFNYCSVKNMQTVGFNGSTLTYAPMNTNNKTTLADFVYIYNIRTDGSPLGVAEINVEGFDPSATTKVTGTVKLLETTKKKLDIAIDGVEIYYKNSDGSKQILTKSDEKGNFTAEKVPTNVKQLFASREGFKEKSNKVILTTAANTVNFEIDSEDYNAVGGALVDTNRKKIKDPPIIVLVNNNNIIQDLAKFDNGVYYLDRIPSGTYQIKVIRAGTLDNRRYYDTEPASPTVTFAKDYGHTEFVNLRILGFDQNQKSIFTPTVREKSLDKGVGPIIPNAEITLFNDALKKAYVFDNNESRSDIPFGVYDIEIKSPGYETLEIENFNIYSSGQKDQFLLTRKSPEGYCAKSAQTYVKEFWFCGTQAKALIKSEKIKTIDTTIGQLQQKYNFPKLPQAVVIKSSDYENEAHYTTSHPKKSDAKICPAPFNIQTMDGEYILISTLYINSITNFEIISMLDHEMAHGMDVQKASCNTERSNQEDFLKLLKIGEVIDDQFYFALTDSTYVKDTGGGVHSGHPYDNPGEAYASAFHAGELFPNELKQKIASYPSFLRQTIEKLVAITQEPNI